VAVSKSTRREFVELLGVPRERIEVVYHGVDHDVFGPAEEEGDDGPERNLGPMLHVSQYQPVKNINRIIEAYSRVRHAGRPPLLIVSKGYRRRGRVPGVEFIEKGIPLEKLADLYRSASIFLFPSIHEGFGLPILEAMASGVPVITSRGTSCEEISGGRAQLVDPRSISGIARAMERLVADASLRRRLSVEGVAYSRRFTWEKAAAGYAEVFRRALTEESR
jgi:glycosyltransferase involved in cell wall biosynthesis